MTEPCELSAVEARRLIGLKQLSPVELLDSCLARIEATNPAVNALVAIDADAARVAAIAAEAAVLSGAPLGLLHGLPVGIKDLSATKGLRTTWGSLLFKDHVPTADDSVVASVRNAGAIVLAKTNTPEFGAGANTTNRVYGATGNPFDPSRTCGGSSGGSAVALALGQLPLCTGSDYGGSLRTPASFCGVTGFRPTPGLVPSTERAAALLPFGVNGPMGRTLGDAYLLLRAQAGTDRRDPFSSGDAAGLPACLQPADLAATRAAFSTDLGCAPVDRAIADAFQQKVATFRHVFREASERAPDFSNVHEVFEATRGIAFVAQHGERLAQHRALLGPNVIDNTERGLQVSARELGTALVEQTRLYKRFFAFFRDVDVLICPAASVSPFPHGELYVREINGAAMPSYMRWLAITYAPTMALAPAVCLPCGLDHTGLPFGIQVIGPNGADRRVLEVAAALEALLAQNPATRRPLPDLGKLRHAGSKPGKGRG